MIMNKHKSEDYKISAVQYCLTKNKNQLQWTNSTVLTLMRRSVPTAPTYLFLR